MVHVEHDEQQTEKETLEITLVIREFSDVFLEEIQKLPARRDIDFTIDLIPSATPVSRASYRMSIPELLELKL